jgi:ABC-type dipeptide/oligopeptide/nickel transport system permease subunit
MSALALVVLLAVVFVALIGPFVAPHSPTALEGIPYDPPSSEFLLGNDYLGEDVLSRVLWGGRTVVLYGALATLLGYAVGAPIGLLAGYSRTWVDPVLMRAMDLLLAFPPILFLLLVATGAGSSATALVIAIAIIHVPFVARVLRAATLEVSVRGYVESAVARGDATHTILRREVLPNIWAPVVADAGPKFTVSILLVASVNFLGLGLSPPAADWAMMISENRSGIALNPWAVVAPAVLIGLLTVSVNLVADSLAHRVGRSVDVRSVRR